VRAARIFYPMTLYASQTSKIIFIIGLYMTIFNKPISFIATVDSAKSHYFYETVLASNASQTTRLRLHLILEVPLYEFKKLSQSQK
jgi:hypothetical protein